VLVAVSFSLPVVWSVCACLCTCVRVCVFVCVCVFGRLSLCAQYEENVVCEKPANWFGPNFEYVQFQILDPEQPNFSIQV